VHKVILTFDIASIGDVSNISFTSDELHREYLFDYTIDGLTVVFTPQEIGFLSCGNSAQVTAYIPIPIGQYYGNYCGYFRAVANGGASDSIRICTYVTRIMDIDLDREEVVLEASPGGSETGLFVVVNPNSWDNNPDPVDGPGNADISPISYNFTDLIGSVGTIPSYAMSVEENETAIPSGESDEVTLRVDVPAGQLAGEYEGKVHVTHPQAKDSLTVRVTVLSHKALDIVEGSISNAVTPPDPWSTVLHPEMTITLKNTGNDILEDIVMASSNLRDTSNTSPEAPFIPGSKVTFIPPSIPTLTPGDSIIITVEVEVAIGLKAAEYTGTIMTAGTIAGSLKEGEGNILSANDEVDVVLEVGGLPDIDIDDDKGNLTGNKMSLIGRFFSGEDPWYHIPFFLVSGKFNIINPNMWSQNESDPYDGPGNIDLENIVYDWTDLICIENCPSETLRIYKKNVDVGIAPRVLASGHAKSCLVTVRLSLFDLGYIPTQHTTFLGEVTATDTVTGVSDEFNLEVIIGENLFPTTGFFGGKGEEEGILLEWSAFGMDEVGYNLYRDGLENGFIKMNEVLLPIGEVEYLDGDVIPGMTYQYQLGLYFEDDSEILLGPIAVQTRENPPVLFALYQNQPNPFSNRTTIRYQISEASPVSLKVYDLNGRLVRTLENGKQKAGFYAVVWDRKNNLGRDVPSGIYFYRLTSGEFVETRKLILLK
jgi:hypothetical protein